MLVSKRKQLALATLTAGSLLLLVVLFTRSAAIPEALQASILGRTNGPSGSSMALVSVTNNTRRTRGFYFSAEVPTPSGWADVNGWVQRQQPLTHRLTAHAACRVVLPAPDGAARWRLCCVSWPEESEIRWTWYLFVRRSGLSRFGFRYQSPASYSWTTQVSQ